MAVLPGLVIKGLELLALCVFDYLPGSECLEDDLGLTYFVRWILAPHGVWTKCSAAVWLWE